MFYAEGFKHTWQIMSWLKAIGLNAYEYGGGRGVKMRRETAELIGDEARFNDIKMSLHAPYYINMVNTEKERRSRNIEYFMDSFQTAKWMSADRIIVHTGSCTGLDRQLALQVTKDLMADIILMADDRGYGSIAICPEVMGKMNQQGTLDEIIEICSIDERLLPCVDFGHVNARSQGGLITKADFENIFNDIENKLGNDRMRKIHMHFSRIEFTLGGEKMHWNYSDIKYGPNFEPLAEVLYEKNIHSRVICESKDDMAQDALLFKQIYEKV